MWGKGDKHEAEDSCLFPGNGETPCISGGIQNLAGKKAQD